MSSPDETITDTDDNQRLERIAELAGYGRTLAVAESLTSGSVSARLGAGSGASDWFRGAVVAYSPAVKFDVLGVDRGPVVSDSCARQMAMGVRSLLGADIGLGLTGVGGPGANEGHPPGTVHLAVASPRGLRSHGRHIPGEPEEVIAAVTRWALDEFVRELTEA